MHTAGTGLAWLDALQPPGNTPITPGAGAAPWFSCPLTSLVSCDWQGSAGSRAVWQERTLALQHQPSALVLQAARVQWGPQCWYKLQIGFASLCWILIVISHNWFEVTELIWYLIRHSLHKQNFPGHYSAGELSWWWHFQWKFCLLTRRALWVLNPLQEPWCCLESERAFFHGGGN